MQKYLENKQSNISGNFRIPRELYNESIGNANTVIVKNGKIVDTAGEDDSFEVDPALEEQKSTYFMIYNEILDYYVENEEYPVMLFDTTIQNKTFDNILNTISFCKFDNCDFANVSVNILDDFSKSGKLCKTIQLTYKSSDYENGFKTNTVSKSLDNYTDSIDELYREGLKLFDKTYKNEEIRLIGFTLKNLKEKHDVVVQMTFENYERHESENKTQLLINELNRKSKKETFIRLSDLKDKKK